MNHKVALVKLTLKRIAMLFKYSSQLPKSKLVKVGDLFELSFSINTDNHFWAQSESIEPLLTGLREFDKIVEKGWYEIP